MSLMGFALFIVISSQRPYLDPGSGSFLLQLMIAGLAGIGLFIGVSWTKIKRLFHKRKDQAEKPEEDENYDD